MSKMFCLILKLNVTVWTSVVSAIGISNELCGISFEADRYTMYQSRPLKFCVFSLTETFRELPNPQI